MEQGDVADLRACAEALSRDLEAVLREVEGAGEVTVWVRLGAGPAREFARDVTGMTRRTEERDSAGGSRVTEENESGRELVITRSGGGESPVVVRVSGVEVTGVVVVADGARSSDVKSMLCEAVSAALGVPPHLVVVLPRGGG